MRSTTCINFIATRLHIWKDYPLIVTTIKKLENCFGNKKKEWEIVNQIARHKKKKKSEIHSLKGENNKILRNGCEIANGLNTHFNSIGQRMANNFPKTNDILRAKR